MSPRLISRTGCGLCLITHGRVSQLGFVFGFLVTKTLIKLILRVLAWWGRSPWTVYMFNLAQPLTQVVQKNNKQGNLKIHIYSCQWYKYFLLFAFFIQRDLGRTRLRLPNLCSRRGSPALVFNFKHRVFLWNAALELCQCHQVLLNSLCYSCI